MCVCMILAEKMILRSNIEFVEPIIKENVQLDRIVYKSILYWFFFLFLVCACVSVSFVFPVVLKIVKAAPIDNMVSVGLAYMTHTKM